VVFFAWSSQLSITAQTRLIDSRTQIKNAIIPICLDADAKLVAVVRTRHIFSDYQRRGFFRIGVLPLLVIDGLEVEIREPSQATAALGAVHSRIVFKEFARKAVEGRNFRLSFGSGEPFVQTGSHTNGLRPYPVDALGDVLTPRPGPTAIELKESGRGLPHSRTLARGSEAPRNGVGGACVLRAETVRLENSDQWRLQDGVVHAAGAEPVNFRYATLQISGPKAGEISCETTNGVVHLNCLSRP